jgi:hypothetical protein
MARPSIGMTAMLPRPTVMPKAPWWIRSCYGAPVHATTTPSISARLAMMEAAVRS